jgi:putative DNA primase/helicase
MVSAFYDGGHSAVTGTVFPEQNPGPRRLNRSQQGDLIRAVQDWYDAGCAVHPAKIDGSKYAIAVKHGSPDIQPDVFPATYPSGRLAGMPHPQAGQPNPEAGQYGYGWGRIAHGDLPRLTPQQIAAHIRSGRADGIGVICGLASGGVMMLEAEGRARHLLPAVRDAAIRQGSLDLLERLSGCVDESPSGGIHFYLRVIGGPTPGNDILAARPVDGGKEVLFETRGQGGWSVVAPSSGRTHKSGKPYRFLRGSPATIPTFTVEELQRLLDVFRAVDEMPAPEPAAVLPADLRRRERPAGDILPGDDFNQRASWGEILVGWKPSQVVGDRRHWTRPGKDHGTSATTTADVLCCYSSNTALPQFTGAGCKNALSKFATYAHLHHGGDFKSAARELWNQGYGSRQDDLDQGDGGQPLPVEPRPAPTGQCRSLDDWRQEVAGRRAAAIRQPGLHLDRSPTGSGKTHATITALPSASASLTVLPTHANVAERVEEMRSQGIDAVAYPELTPDTCQNYDQASQAQSLGLVAGAAVCPGCPFKDDCTYRAGVKAAAAAPHRVATHERLRRSDRTADGVQVVVIDECPESVVAPTLTVPAGQITPVETLAHAIRNHWYSRADHDQKAFAGTLLDVVAAIHATCAGITTPGTVNVDLGQIARQVPENWQRLLFGAIRQVGVGKDLSSEALALVTKAAAGDLERLQVVTDLTLRGRLRHYLVGSWRPGLPADAAVIMLDATGQADDIEAATGQPVDDCTPAGHLPTVQPVVQLVDDISRGASTSTVAGVIEAFLDRRPDVERLGIIGHQPHITALIDQGELGSAARERVVKWCYFGQGPDRASNDWHRECDHLLVLGTPRANPGDHRRWLVQHGLHEAASRPDGDWGARHWESVTTSGASIIVAGTGYRDPDWHRAAVAVNRSTLHQAVGRGRSILPEGIPVTVVSSDPTPYPVAPALDAQPAALRATVDTIRGLLAPAPVSLLSAIESPYREKYGSGAVPTGDIVLAVVGSTRTADKPAGVGRSAVEKRLRQCLAAGLLTQPKRGWWSLPGTPAPAPDDLVQAAPVRAAAPAILTPLTPAVVIEAVPPESADDAVQIVSPAILPAVTTDTVTTDAPLELPTGVDAVLELVEERAAILEYDGGYDRETADRLAREMVLGRDAATAGDPGGAVVELAAGVDHAGLHARTHPLVAESLTRFPGTVRLLTDKDDPFAGRRRASRPAPGHCRCGADDWVSVPIHGGRSTRVECRHCDRYGWWGVWYGKRQPPPWGDLETPDAVPSPADQEAQPTPAAGRGDSLSFAFLPVAHALPTGSILAG